MIKSVEEIYTETLVKKEREFNTYVSRHNNEMLHLRETVENAHKRATMVDSIVSKFGMEVVYFYSTGNYCDIRVPATATMNEMADATKAVAEALDTEVTSITPYDSGNAVKALLLNGTTLYFLIPDNAACKVVIEEVEETVTQKRARLVCAEEAATNASNKG